MMPCRWKMVRSAPLWAFIVSFVFVGPVAAETEARCRDILQQALADTNPDTRKHAVAALSLVGAPWLSSLKDMLQDKEIEVRLATVASLAEVKGPEAVVALLDALNDEASEVSFAAAKTLAGRRDPVGRQALLAVLEGESKTSSGFFSKHKRNAERITHNPRTLLLFAAQRGIGFVPIPYLGVGVASMKHLLNDPEVSGRAAAAMMLANETDQVTLKALRVALTDKDWSVRAAAVHALVLRRDARLQAELPPLLDDEHEAVRLRAAAGYLRVTAGPKRARGDARPR